MRGKPFQIRFFTEINPSWQVNYMPNETHHNIIDSLYILCATAFEEFLSSY